MKCAYLTPEGRCHGKYKGFTCIGEKCKADKEPPCEHNDQEFYCRKFNRFGCVGLGNCNTLDDYLKCAHTSKARS